MSVFHTLFEDFPGTWSFFPDPDPYRFCLDPDPYQSSPWIRIRNEIFQILDPDPYQNDTDPQHCYVEWSQLQLDVNCFQQKYFSYFRKHAVFIHIFLTSKK